MEKYRAGGGAAVGTLLRGELIEQGRGDGGRMRAQDQAQ